MLAICANACVTTMYPGPRRPDGETILVETDGTNVERIDGTAPPNGSKFRLLPGDHRLALTLDDQKMGGRRISHLPQSICFFGRPGHAYLARPTYAGPVWRPEMIDETTTYATSSSDCSSQAQRRIARAPVVAAAPAGPDLSALEMAQPGDPQPNSGAAADQKEAPPAEDIEVPRAPAQPQTLPPTFEPRLDIGAELGLVQGGAELATAMSSDGNSETIGAGDGLLAVFAIRFTPVWLAHRVGLGLGGAAGVKYWSVGGNGGEASTSKYLLGLSGHALFSVDPSWLVVLQAGIEKDLGIDFSINGSSAGLPFESRTGFVADLGAQRAFGDHWSFAFSARVTILDYDVQGTTVGANSVGLILSLHYTL